MTRVTLRLCCPVTGCKLRVINSWSCTEDVYAVHLQVFLVHNARVDSVWGFSVSSKIEFGPWSVDFVSQNNNLLLCSKHVLDHIHCQLQIGTKQLSFVWRCRASEWRSWCISYILSNVISDCNSDIAAYYITLYISTIDLLGSRTLCSRNVKVTSSDILIDGD